MKKEDKALVIESLKQTIQNYSAFYLVDVTGLDSTTTSNLRRKCFKSEVKMVVVKNTLLQKALDQLDADYSPLYDSLKSLEKLEWVLLLRPLFLRLFIKAPNKR